MIDNLNTRRIVGLRYLARKTVGTPMAGAFLVLLVASCGGSLREVQGARFELNAQEDELAYQYEQGDPRGAGLPARCDYWRRRTAETTRDHAMGMLIWHANRFVTLREWAGAKAHQACTALAEQRAAHAEQRAAQQTPAALPAPIVPPVVEEPAPPAAPPRPLGAAEVAVLVDALPLNTDTVNFAASDRFLALYEPFTANKALIKNARQEFRTARKWLATDLSVFKLTRNYAEVLPLIKPPAVNNALTVFYAVQSGVLGVQNAILDFQEQARGKLSRDQQVQIAQQVEGTSSTASQNLREISSLISNFRTASGVFP